MNDRTIWIITRMILSIILLNISGCNDRYGVHEVNAPLVSRHRGFAIMRFYDSSSLNARFGFTWTNSYVSGITIEKAIGIREDYSDNSIQGCVLAKWLSRARC